MPVVMTTIRHQNTAGHTEENKKSWWRRMLEKEFYWCMKCKKWHRADSEEGKEHKKFDSTGENNEV